MLNNKHTLPPCHVIKMAPNGGSEESLLNQNDIYSLLNDRIEHILRKSGSISQDSLVDQLIEDEDDVLLSETRDTIFKKAILKYACLTRQASGMQFDPDKIEMKQRKGENKLQSYAKDCVSLFLWYVELVSEFPRSVLKGDGTYLDVQPVQTDRSNQPKIDACLGNMAKSNESVNKDDVIANHVGAQNSCNRCSQYTDLLERLADSDRAMSNLRSHVLSIEKILYDEILSVRSISETNLRKIELLCKSAPRSHTQQKPAEKPADSNKAAADAKAEKPPSQPSASPGSPESQSYSQLMRDDPTQATEGGTQGSPPGSENAESADSSTEDIYEDASENRSKVDKGTSPVLVKFGDKSSDRSYRNNKSQSAKSDIRRPTMRPNQDTVNDISDEDDGWETVRGRGKQRNKAPVTGLQGRKQESFEELYLSNIAKRDTQTHQDVAHEIRTYCKKKDLRVMNVWVVPNRVADDTVGCKIRVPLRQVDDALDSRMWPSDITCKRWRKRPPLSDDTPSTPPRSSGDRSRQRGRGFAPTRRPSRSVSKGSRGRSRSNQSRGSRNRSSSRSSRHDWFDGERRN